MAALALSFLLVTALVDSCKGQGFLQRAAVEAETNGVLSEVLGHGHGVTQHKLAKIHTAIEPLFHALPKNRKGHLSGQVMRYAVRRYFNHENAWIVKGFEPHAELVNTTEESENILKGRVPAFVRAVFEEKLAHDGFSLDGVVSMIAAIETLVFDEVVTAMETAFWFQDFSATDSLSFSDMSNVITSYFITEMYDGTRNKEEHRSAMQKLHDTYIDWDKTELFLLDVVGSEIFRTEHGSNPFIGERMFSFTDMVRIAERSNAEFAKWSAYQCQDMKDLLVGKESVQGSGRMKLADFYKSEGYQTESPEYLRQLGALDESSQVLGPQVLIANYVSGMSNCITSKSYYSMCCPNECDQIYQHVETSIASSTASPSDIVKAVESLPHSPDVSESLRAQIEEVGKLHKGKVPLHGRLVAQWLHFTFPHECPYPHEAGTIAPKTPPEWLEAVGDDDIRSASNDELEKMFGVKPRLLTAAMEAEEITKSWTHAESLLVASTPSDEISSSPQWFRFAGQVCILLSFVAVTIREVSQLAGPAKKIAREYDV